MPEPNNMDSMRGTLNLYVQMADENSEIRNQAWFIWLETTDGKRLQYWVYRLSRRFNFSEIEAEDMFQNTLLQLFITVKNGKFDSQRGSMVSLAQTIANRQAYKLLKSKKSYNKNEITLSYNQETGDDPIEGIPDIIETCEEMVIHSDQLRQLKNSSSKLERDILELVYVNGQDNKSSAHKLGISYQNLRTILCRLRKRLRFTND